MTPIPSCSRHASVRAQQRGITPAQIDAVRRYGDREAPRGHGCVSVWISRRKLQQLGALTPEGVSTDRLHGVIVLQSRDQEAITVLRNRNAKTYRRAPLSNLNRVS